MEQRRAIQKSIRVNYANLIDVFKATYCKTCAYWYEAFGEGLGRHYYCRMDLLPVTAKGDACPYHKLRLDEALQSKSTGIKV